MKVCPGFKKFFFTLLNFYMTLIVFWLVLHNFGLTTSLTNVLCFAFECTVWLRLATVDVLKIKTSNSHFLQSRQTRKIYYPSFRIKNSTLPTSTTQNVLFPLIWCWCYEEGSLRNNIQCNLLFSPSHYSHHIHITEAPLRQHKWFMVVCFDVFSVRPMRFSL